MANRALTTHSLDVCRALDRMVSDPTSVLEIMRQDRVAAVVRGRRVEDPARFAETCASAGIRCVEFTFTIPDAARVIEQATRAEGAVIGAGTVLTDDQARRAIDAGARFVVSPGVVPDVAVVCRDRDVPLFMGAYTPSEVVRAYSLGAAAIKIFPAGDAGPAYLKALRGPFPTYEFVPSGGVNATNARQFLDAGAMAVFAGSDLATPASVEGGDHAYLARAAALFVAAVSA